MCMSIIPGSKYRHYKGNEYEIVGVGKHSDTHEDFVVYRGLYDSSEFGPKPLWVKPVAAFLEKVIVEGKEVNRFEQII